MELNERQKTILMMVVRDYTDKAQPVSSKVLVDRYHLDVSSATVRNELAVLTEMGFLHKPHIMSGSVPTEEGYRYFVSEMMNQVDLPSSIKRTITHQFYQSRPDTDQWMTLAASVLAHQSQALSIITAPQAETTRFKHVELISTQGRQILMVLVLVGGEVLQQILTLAEPVSQERLSRTALRLNEVLSLQDVETITSLGSRSDALEQDILLLIRQDIRNAEKRVSGELYLDGLSNVLSEPEFSESDEARRTLKLFEERSMLKDVLARSMPSASVGGVQVVIGGDSNWEELRQCSIVLARYGVPGMVTGMLGVVGPMRMSYARTIPTVRFMAGLLSDLVNNTVVGE